VSPVLEQRGVPSAAVTGASPTAVGGKPRVIGVDVARGLALVGMMAAHAFVTIDDNGNPTLAHLVAGGRAASLFVLVAGVSLAFLSGGRTALRGRDRVGGSAGLAVRAVLIGAMGLALGYLAPLNGIDGILAFYGLFFLLAIPLLGLPPLVLAGVAIAAITLGPVLIVATAIAGLPYAGDAADPTFSTLIHEPGSVLVQLLLTGEYPAVVYLAYLCLGLAIGRLDLRSRRLSWWLLGGGLALAIAAQAVSALLLHPVGGLAQLIQQGDLADDPAGAAALLWEPEPPTSWWYLALPTPHSHTPIDLLHTLGSAAAVLGAALLLTRMRSMARALAPLAAAGSMSLTLYSAHLVLLASGVLRERPLHLFLAMAIGALVLASAWRRWLGQGPLEKVVATAATAARRALTNLIAARSSTSSTSTRTRRVFGTAARGGAQFLGPVTCAAVLALTFWAGTQFTARPGHAAESAAGTASELSEAANPDLVIADPAQSPPHPTAHPGQTDAPAPADEPATDRYCDLADQLYTIEETYPDQPRVVAEKGNIQLNELPQVAPVEIRDAVAVIVNNYRAEAGSPEAATPDEATLSRAEATVEAFENETC
jgi:uncharacterized membrane protein